MKKTVFVTGANGLVGTAIRALENKYPEFSFFFADRTVADLTDQLFTKDIFDAICPNYVIHTAARVGGIGRNLNSPVQQYNDNILMNTNVIQESFKHNVEKLIAFSSVCVFPAKSNLLKEDIMHDGPPFPAHWSYAMAKRMVDVQIEAYRNQYNCNYCSVIPGNIFGINDNYNLDDGHVVPSLIHKFYNGWKNKTAVEIWGDGTPRREFLFAEDIAKVCLELFRMDSRMPQKLIVSGKELQIMEMVQKIMQVYGDIQDDWIPAAVYNTQKPNGQARRPTDMSLFWSLFPNFKFSDIDESLNKSVRWFVENYENARK